MYGNIVSSFFRNYNDRETYFTKIWLHNATVVCVIWFSFFTHEKIKCWSYGLNKWLGTVTRITWIGSVSNIFSMLASVDNFWIDSSGHKPAINGRKTIITISWISTMMIISFSFCKLNGPIVCCWIESIIYTVWLESWFRSYGIGPWEPLVSYTIHIYICWRWCIGTCWYWWRLNLFL